MVEMSIILQNKRLVIQDREGMTFLSSEGSKSLELAAQYWRFSCWVYSRIELRY